MSESVPFKLASFRRLKIEGFPGDDDAGSPIEDLVTMSAGCFSPCHATDTSGGASILCERSTESDKFYARRMPDTPSLGERHVALTLPRKASAAVRHSSDDDAAEDDCQDATAVLLADMDRSLRSLDVSADPTASMFLRRSGSDVRPSHGSREVALTLPSLPRPVDSTGDLIKMTGKPS